MHSWRNLSAPISIQPYLKINLFIQNEILLPDHVLDHEAVGNKFLKDVSQGWLFTKIETELGYIEL